MLKKYNWRDYDIKLVLMVISITVIGFLAISSAEEGLQKKQILGFALGMVLMIVLSLIDYHYFLKIAPILYLLNIGLLLWVEFAGHKVLGAVRWVVIFGVSFQPSETSKILLIIVFATFIMKYEKKISSFKILLMAVVLIAPPLVLIYHQPDLSTTIVTAIIFLSMLYVGGVNYKIVLGAIALAVPTVIYLFIQIIQPNPKYEIIKDYQRDRILAWLHPEDYALEEAYQQLNSIMAIGSGQLTGKGLNNNVVSSVKNGNFISEPQTDFIFTIIGEELGFIGACTVILLLALIAIECLSIAYKAKDTAGKIIGTGMAALIGFQSMLNIAVTTGLMPNTGITLPFVSAGLTSLVSLYMGIGFVLNVRLQCIRKNN